MLRTPCPPYLPSNISPVTAWRQFSTDKAADFDAIFDSNVDNASGRQSRASVGLSSNDSGLEEEVARIVDNMNQELPVNKRALMIDSYRVINVLRAGGFTVPQSEAVLKLAQNIVLQTQV